MAKSQVGFANFVVLPSWDTLAVSLPPLQLVCDLIRCNTGRWDAQHKHLLDGQPLDSLSAAKHEAEEARIFEQLRALRPVGLLAALSQRGSEDVQEPPPVTS